ncbi:MAG: hypothetical protein QGI09_10190, partial [Dehalococcoidia bacterium]|nr:hypothetical protein [Dehalococcoidia bacterium]
MSDRRAFDGFCAGIDDQPRPRTVLHGEPVDEEHFQDLSKGQFLPFCPDLTHRFEYIACNDPDDEGLFKELFGQRRKVAEECEMWSARRLMDSSGEHMYPEFLEHFYEPPCPCPLYQPVEIAGTYFSSPHRIEYYKGAHKTITTLHERFHALHHLTPDSNGDIWIDFPRAGRFAKEMLAQLFTY